MMAKPAPPRYRHQKFRVVMTATVPGDPVGKGRPRFNFSTKRAFTPPKTKAWEKKASKAFKDEWGDRPPLTDLVKVYVISAKERPQRLRRKKDPMTAMWDPAKPDGDNILKAAVDALVNARVIDDDNLVVRWIIDKTYIGKHEEPRVIVQVSILEPEPDPLEAIASFDDEPVGLAGLRADNLPF